MGTCVGVCVFSLSETHTHPHILALPFSLFLCLLFICLLACVCWHRFSLTLFISLSVCLFHLPSFLCLSFIHLFCSFLCVRFSHLSLFPYLFTYLSIYLSFTPLFLLYVWLHLPPLSPYLSLTLSLLSARPLSAPSFFSQPSLSSETIPSFFFFRPCRGLFVTHRPLALVPSQNFAVVARKKRGAI